MSKLTLLCGPPQSGKTAVGIKIAQEIYYHFKGSVIYISADTVTPFMGLVFQAQAKNNYTRSARRWSIQALQKKMFCGIPCRCRKRTISDF